MSLPQRALVLNDLIELVTNETGDVQKIIEKAYDWEHTRWLEAGKWLLASGTASMIGDVTLAAKEIPPSPLYLFLLGFGGAIAAISGLGAFWKAATISSRLARVTYLANRLQEIKPFLRQIRSDNAP